jgi:carbon-monoxide dehydrogenase small subunit
MAQKPLQLKVNGQSVVAEVEPAKLLLDFLRDDLGLTGTKEGCGTGDCGACTVHMDGKAVHSCLTLALEANGAEVTTVEGLTPADGLHPVQAAIVEYGGTQCGFCIPGFVMMAAAFLKEHPHPSEDELRMGIAGNLCRCTGYDKIVRAVQDAARVMKGA